jgi:hypothetical protein
MHIHLLEMIDGWSDRQTPQTNWSFCPEVFERQIQDFTFVVDELKLEPKTQKNYKCEKKSSREDLPLLTDRRSKSLSLKSARPIH